jgi:predicted anti-sigma-YlaC factor YlaD
VTCEALINKFLMDYHTGSLSLARKLDFELHLTLCSECRKYVDSYRKTIMLAKHSGELESPIPEELVKAILTVTEKDRKL